MYKLRDGPLDWHFCNEAEALEWLVWRHANPTMHAFLRLPRTERLVELAGRTVSEYAQMTLSEGH